MDVVEGLEEVEGWQVREVDEGGEVVAWMRAEGLAGW